MGGSRRAKGGGVVASETWSLFFRVWRGIICWKKLEGEGGMNNERNDFRFGATEGTCEKLQIFSSNFLRLERG